MSRTRSNIRNSAILVAGQAGSQGIIFVRNVLVARILGPAQFGVAAALAMTASLLEMLSNINADKLLIQAHDGDDVPLQSSAQLLHFLRGLTNAGILFGLAGVLSSMFHVPTAKWAFQLVALIPLVGGFAHLDSKRFQRRMIFGPDIAIELAQQSIALVAGVCLAWWLKSFSAVLWTLLLQWFVSVIASHVVSERPYRWRFDRLLNRRLVAFGWPLMLNGLLMFTVFQGDRFVVGKHFGVEMLANYSVAISLCLLPVMFVGRIVNSLLLPHLARAQDDHEEFAERCRIFAEGLSVVAGVLAIGFAVGGDSVIKTLYGSRYQGAGVIIAWLGAAQAISLCRFGPIVAGLAKGNGTISMVSNFIRALGLLASVAILFFGGGLLQVAQCALIFEFLATVTAVMHLRVRYQIPVGVNFVPLFQGSMVTSLVILVADLAHPTSTFGQIGMTILAILGGIAAYAALFPRLRGLILNLHGRPSGEPINQMGGMSPDSATSGTL